MRAMHTTVARLLRRGRRLAVAVLLLGSLSCSPGTLPGSPSALLVGGGGARYNGSITYQRLSGSHVISEAAHTMQISIAMTSGGQITAHFQTTQNNGTLAGEVDGNLADGFLQATLLVSLLAQAPGGGSVTCEGRGEVFGRLSGLNLSWNASSITYENCPGLLVGASAQAVAVSPIPGRSGNRANVLVAVPGGTTVAAGVCGTTGTAGYPFTVEVRETAGIDITFDDTFRVEERRNFEELTSLVLDMPFTRLRGGTRLTYGACSTSPGTYQAFFSGTDANGNRFRIASPIVTFGGEGRFQAR